MSARPLEEEQSPLGAYDRGLAFLTRRTVGVLQQQAPPSADLREAAREVLEELPFSLASGRFDLFSPGVRGLLPARVVEAWRFFCGLVEATGRGRVRVFDLPVSAEHDAVYVVYAELAARGVLEVYGADGEPLLSGRTSDDELSSWDEAFGAVRDELRGL